MTPKTWSVSGLAVELKLDRRTVAAALAGVEPADEDGRGRRYLMADAVHALYGAGAEGDARLDLNQESAALKKTQREKIELEIAVLRGELIPAENVGRTWANFVSACRARLLVIPPVAAVQVVGGTVREVETELRDMIFAALEELKEYEPGDYGTVATAAMFAADTTDIEDTIEGRA